MALKEMAERKNSPPWKGENRLKEREAENVLKQLMTAQTAGEGSCLPINEVLVLICHLDCTSELVRRRGRKNKNMRLKRAGEVLGCLLAVQMSLGFGEAGEARGAGGKPCQPTGLACGENGDKVPWACVGRAALGHGTAQLRDAHFPGITSHHLLG